MKNQAKQPMTIRLEDAMEPILRQLDAQLSPNKKKHAGTIAQAFFKRTPIDEIQARSAESWAAIIIGLLELVNVRQPEQVFVRVFNPNNEEHGWEATHTAIEVLSDDNPFLVDSVGIVFQSLGTLVHSAIHPVLGVERDASGHLLSVSEEASKPKEKLESLMYFEVDRHAEAQDLIALQQAIEGALRTVGICVRDWAKMRDKALAIAGDLDARAMPVDPATRAEAQALLLWMANDHFTFLGFREYEVAMIDREEVLRVKEGSGMGILSGQDSSPPRPLKSLAAHDLQQSGNIIDPIILTKTNARSTVHHPGYMDYISVLKFDASGRPIGEERFLGLFTSSAYTARPWDIPLVRHKYEAVMRASDLKRDSHSGKTLRHILESLPREELFQSSIPELSAVALGILNLQERQRTKLFVRRDRYDRFFSCLVFLPRDRFNQDIRERIEALLKKAFHGERLDSTVQVSESALARMHLIIRIKPNAKVKFDIAELERKLEQIVRNWHDELRDILVQKHGEDKGLKLANRYGKALPAGYIEEVTPWIAAADVEAAASLAGMDDIRLSLYRSRRSGQEGSLHFKLFRYGAFIPLSDALPMLENMGLKVFSEHPYEMDLAGSHIFIQDFEVSSTFKYELDIENAKQDFQNAFENIWRQKAENDGFNRLILGAGLDWRQVSVLRGYCKYLLQIGVPFSQAYMEETLNHYPLHARLIVELFEAKFDPNRETMTKSEPEAGRRNLLRDIEPLLGEDLKKNHLALLQGLSTAFEQARPAQMEAVAQLLSAVMDTVNSIDEDRILRSFTGVIKATLRTNFYQSGDHKHEEYVSFKLDPAKIAELPKPRPYREIFVYSPRVEGVHLRFGSVARGGLRWSDRREDFRTEVLGLVKAQMVKNTVIVPVGAKGGFFVKRPPAGGDRDAQLAEGVACYRLFINGLLDITDNLVDDDVIYPKQVVRHDGVDPYLVVAADKGTATFSDIANAVSAEHGFWLGDAFASGGSNGYDHKVMGITAKGAWESVKRHFRALGRNCQEEAFTCTGIGDMSGDVFGNGMLLSKHIRLLAAFDHRHVFLDPNPDAARSFEERARLFKLPRSSWENYDAKLISAGGGVFARTLKAIPLSAEAKQALGIDPNVAQMTPQELMSAILKAPVDLLWNGGIGTYVKAAHETHADVGDRANNAIRINGADLRCKIVGEGGNLGCSQLGRIEAALNGVLLNTDFIDNSAGVDTSDHEVNIKILLNDAVGRGQITVEARNQLLASMTPDVETLVIRDNYLQNQAISVMERMSVQRLGAKQHFIRTLELQGLLDRQLEYLPSDAELSERKARGQGLTRPELAILLSYAKIVLYQQLLDSEVPEDPHLSKELMRYFPKVLRGQFTENMQRHRLRREIIATAVTNSIINRMGATFILRMQEDTGEMPAQIAKAYAIAREVLEVRDLWAGIESMDGKVHGNSQMDALLRIWNLIRNATRWLLNLPGERLDIASAVSRYAPGLNALRNVLENILPEGDRAILAEEKTRWLKAGFSKELSETLAQFPMLASGLDIVEIALEHKRSVEKVGQVYFALGEALHLRWLMARLEELPVDGRWHAQARSTLRDELFNQQRALVSQILMNEKAQENGGISVKRWLNQDDSSLRFTLAMFSDMRNQVHMDYPTIFVAVRRIGQLLQAGSRKHNE